MKNSELSKEVKAFLKKRSEALSAINNYPADAESLDRSAAMLSVLLEWEYLSVCRLEEAGAVKQFNFDLYDKNDGLGFECLQSGRRFEIDHENGDDIELTERKK